MHKYRYDHVRININNNKNQKIATFISLHGFKTMTFEFSLKSWYRKLVSELNFDTGKALKCGYEGVQININNNENHKNSQINNLAWVLNDKIWIPLEKLIQKTCLKIEFRHWEVFKMLIWRLYIYITT